MQKLHIVASDISR